MLVDSTGTKGANLEDNFFFVFPMNGHTLGFCPWNQKLENFVTPGLTLGVRVFKKI